jgi:hypothetical protein
MWKCEMEVISLHTGLYANQALAGSRAMFKIRRPPLGTAVPNVALKPKFLIQCTGPTVRNSSCNRTVIADWPEEIAHFARPFGLCISHRSSGRLGRSGDSTSTRWYASTKERTHP